MIAEKPYVAVDPRYYCCDWILVIPATKRYHRQQFELGEDVQFVNQVLRMTPTEVVAEMQGILGSPPNLNSLRTRQALAAFIISRLGGLRQVRQAGVWDFCAQ